MVHALMHWENIVPLNEANLGGSMDGGTSVFSEQEELENCYSKFVVGDEVPIAVTAAFVSYGA